MAIEFIQHTLPTMVQDKNMKLPVIPRLTKVQVASLKLSEISPVEYLHHVGIKNPKPPKVIIHRGQQFEDLMKQHTSLNKAMQLDFEWLVGLHKSDFSGELACEWSGHMKALAREDNSIGQPTQYVFGPLIDRPPAHPDTVLTTMTYFQQVMHQQGSPYCILTADMQLFKVASQIRWCDPDKWQTIVLHPGGMHTLMSFLGAIGHLMKGSGLEEILGAAFSGINSMLNGKAWPRAMRGFRMVTTALLQQYILAGTTEVANIEEELEVARNTPTGRMWVDCFIIPTFLAHLFVRAEREGDWLLHMYCLRRMLPYFFASSYWNYARYIHWYIQDMDANLPPAIKEQYLTDGHTCRHAAGVWNAVSEDQFGEQTYIRYGKSKGGLVGISLSADQVAGWVLSHHVCDTLPLAMDEMFADREYDERADKHKEETEGRKTLDYEDRKKIREELEKGCNPLNTESYHPVNVSNGRVSNSCVNVQDSLQIGTRMVAQFTAGQPDNFYKPLSKQVTTMESLKKSITVGDRQVYDIETIYSRMLVIGQKGCINLREVFMYELSPVPFSLFDQYGDMLSGTKSTLTHRLAQYIPDTDTPNLVIVDGIALIYHVIWPQNGTVQILWESMISRVDDVNIVDDVYIVFDRYKTGSIKEHELVRRNKGHATPKHKLTLTTVLPARDVIMKNTFNKQQLAHLLCMCHVPPSVHMLEDVDNIFEHEEADVSMVSYANKFAKEGKKEIQILADDTDVFVLLMHWFHKHCPNSHVTLRKFDGQIIDINVSSEMLGDPCANLLVMHALTGCDSVWYPLAKAKSMRSRYSRLIVHL